MPNVTIIDYGLGNIGSIANMIKKCGGTCTTSNDIRVIEMAEKIILPGVGSFDAGISNIEQYSLREVLKYKALEQRVPFMGICLGMQLLTHGSEEGKLSGLGYVNGYCHRFQPSPGILIPHMGWSEVQIKKNSSIFKFERQPRYYFVHSYHAVLSDASDTLLTSRYGTEFCAGFERDNIVGFQFHPEKSHSFGKEIFRSFLNL